MGILPDIGGEYAVAPLAARLVKACRLFLLLYSRTKLWERKDGVDPSLILFYLIY